MPLLLKWNGNNYELLNEAYYKASIAHKEKLIGFSAFRQTGSGNACQVKNGVCTKCIVGAYGKVGNPTMIAPGVEGSIVRPYMYWDDDYIETIAVNAINEGFRRIYECSMIYLPTFEVKTKSHSSNIFVYIHAYYEFITNFASVPNPYNVVLGGVPPLQPYNRGYLKNGESSSGKYIYSTHCTWTDTLGTAQSHKNYQFPCLQYDTDIENDFRNGTKTFEMTNMTLAIEVTIAED